MEYKSTNPLILIFNNSLLDLEKELSKSYNIIKFRNLTDKLYEIYSVLDTALNDSISSSHGQLNKSIISLNLETFKRYLINSDNNGVLSRYNELDRVLYNFFNDPSIFAIGSDNKRIFRDIDQLRATTSINFHLKNIQRVLNIFRTSTDYNTNPKFKDNDVIDTISSIIKGLTEDDPKINAVYKRSITNIQNKIRKTFDDYIIAKENRLTNTELNDVLDSIQSIKKEVVQNIVGLNKINSNLLASNDVLLPSSPTLASIGEINESFKRNFISAISDVNKAIDDEINSNVSLGDAVNIVSIRISDLVLDSTYKFVDEFNTKFNNTTSRFMNSLMVKSGNSYSEIKALKSPAQGTTDIFKTFVRNSFNDKARNVVSMKLSSVLNIDKLTVDEFLDALYNNVLKDKHNKNIVLKEEEYSAIINALETEAMANIDKFSDNEQVKNNMSRLISDLTNDVNKDNTNIVLKDYKKAGITPENVAKLLIENIRQTTFVSTNKEINNRAKSKALAFNARNYIYSLYRKPDELQLKSAAKNPALYRIFNSERYVPAVRRGAISINNYFKYVDKAVYLGRNNVSIDPKDIIRDFSEPPTTDSARPVEDQMRGGVSAIRPENISEIPNERISPVLANINQLGRYPSRRYLVIKADDACNNTSRILVVKKVANMYIVYDRNSNSQDSMDYMGLKKLVQSYSNNSTVTSFMTNEHRLRTNLQIVADNSGFKTLKQLMYNNDVALDIETITENNYMEDYDINKIASMSFTPVKTVEAYRTLITNNSEANRNRSKNISIINQTAVVRAIQQSDDMQLARERYKRFLITNTQNNLPELLRLPPYVKARMPRNTISLTEAVVYSDPVLHETIESINNVSQIIKGALYNISTNDNEYRRYQRVISGTLNSIEGGYRTQITGNVGKRYFGVSLVGRQANQSFRIPATFRAYSLVDSISTNTNVTPTTQINPNTDIIVVNKAILPSTSIIREIANSPESARHRVTEMLYQAIRRGTGNSLFHFNNLTDETLKQHIRDALDKTTYFTYNASYNNAGRSRISLPYDFSEAIRYLTEKIATHPAQVTADERLAYKQMTDLQCGLNPEGIARGRPFNLTNSKVINVGKTDESMAYSIMATVRAMTSSASPLNNEYNDFEKAIMHTDVQNMMREFYNIKVLHQNAESDLKKLDPTVNSVEYNIKLNTYRDTEAQLNKMYSNLFYIMPDKQTYNDSALTLKSFGNFDINVLKKFLMNFAGVQNLPDIPYSDYRTEIMANLLENSSLSIASSANNKSVVNFLQSYLRQVGVSNKKIKEILLNLGSGGKYSTGYSVENLYSLLENANHRNAELHYDFTDNIDAILQADAATKLGEFYNNDKFSKFYDDIANLYTTVYQMLDSSVNVRTRINARPLSVDAYRQAFDTNVGYTGVANIAERIVQFYEGYNTHRNQENVLHNLTEDLNRSIMNILPGNGQRPRNRNIGNIVIAEHTLNERNAPHRTWFTIEYVLNNTVNGRASNPRTNPHSIRLFDSNMFNKKDPTGKYGFKTQTLMVTNIALNNLYDQGLISIKQKNDVVNHIKHELDGSNIINGFRQEAADGAVNKIISKVANSYADTFPSVLFLGAVKIGEKWFTKQKQKDIEREAAYIANKQKNERSYVPSAIPHNVSPWTIANRLMFSDFGSGATSRLKAGIGASQAQLAKLSASKLKNKTIAGVTKLFKMIMDTVSKNPTNSMLFGVGAGVIISTGLIANYAVKHPRNRRNIKKFSADPTKNNYLETMRHDNIYTVVNRKLYAGYGSEMEPIGVQGIGTVAPGEKTPDFDAAHIRTDNAIVVSNEQSQVMSEKGYPPHELIDIIAYQEPGIVSINGSDVQIPSGISKASRVSNKLPVYINKTTNAMITPTMLSDAINDNALQEHYTKYPVRNYANNAFQRTFSLNKADMSATGAQDIYTKKSPRTMNEREMSYLSYNSIRSLDLLMPSFSNLNRYIDRNIFRDSVQLNRAIQPSIIEEYTPAYFNYPKVPNIPLIERSKYSGKQQFRYSPDLSWIRY